jgi:hypothetical protein
MTSKILITVSPLQHGRRFSASLEGGRVLVESARARCWTALAR